MSLMQPFNAAAAGQPLVLETAADLGVQLLDLVKRPLDGNKANLNINERAQDLLRRGAALDIKDPEQGRTAVIWATVNCRAKILGAILDRHPALDARGNDGLSALDHALKKKDKLAIGLLQQAQADARKRLMQELGDVTSRRDFTPLKPANIRKRRHELINPHGQGRR